MTITNVLLIVIAMLALVYPLCRFAPRYAGWVFGAINAVPFFAFVVWSYQIADGEIIRQSIRWVPSMALELSFTLDGLSLIFSMMITGIGSLIFVYAGGYLGSTPKLPSFYSSLIVFEVGMLGMVLSDNLLCMFVFWEITTISSFLLIGYKHADSDARDSALQALIVTGLGGLALLTGILWLGSVAGSYSIDILAGLRPELTASRIYPALLTLFLMGAFTKSAQFPFHFWLPGAMAAPAPISAYLHSATMVKAGVYLLLRMTEVLGGTALWSWSLLCVGGLTMVTGAILAVGQRDLKRLLAYSTVSALGSLVMLTGLGTPFAISACLVFMVGHAMYKGALFMCAGIIEHETGERDIEKLGGLKSSMKKTFVVAGLAALAMAGLGPFLSFIGKELLKKAVLKSEEGAVILVAVAVVTAATFVAVAFLVFFRPFFGAKAETRIKPHDPPFSMLVGPALLAVLGMVAGILSAIVGTQIIAPAVVAITNDQIFQVDLGLWHGVNTALILSILSVVLGSALYAARLPLQKALSGAEPFPVGFARCYGFSLSGVKRFSVFITNSIQNGSLPRYLLMFVFSLIGMAAFSVLTRKVQIHTLDNLPIQPFHVMLAVLICAGSIGAVLSRRRLGAIVSLGVVGFGIAMSYVAFGAPDLAITQILVETLTVILFVLALYHLPQFSPTPSLYRRLRDGVISLAVGATMMMLTLLAIGHQWNPPVSDYYSVNAVPGGNGRNVVNVILVDFRALDTMGEITVIAVAALGIYALLKISKGERASDWYH